MITIIESALGNFLEVLLSWLPIQWAYGSAKSYVKVKTKDRYTDLSYKEKTLPYIIAFFIASMIATIAFFLRTRGGIADDKDYIHCLTVLFVLLLPACVGLTSGYYDYEKELDN